MPTYKHLEKRCNTYGCKIEAQKKLIAELVESLEGMLIVFEDMIPGVGNIVQLDYARLNSNPIRARKAITLAKENK
ncbi:MAG: hypothetical protein QQN44_06110 [Nitrosopumilus sp.]